MQAMQRLAPQIKELQEKYKDDKQRQQQEMMAFYKEHQVNPFGSCLPLLLQMPVFLSLFYMLRKDLKLDICPQKLVDIHAVQVVAGIVTSSTTRCCRRPPAAPPTRSSSSSTTSPPRPRAACSCC